MMGNLMRVEFYKLKKSLSYKLLLAALFVFEVNFARNEIGNGLLWTGVVYTGAQWLGRVPMQAGLYVFFLWFYVAAYVSGEFSRRTFALSFLCGFPRNWVIRAKATAFFVGLLPMMLVHTVAGTVVWSLRFGFGMAFGLEMIMFIGKSLVYCVIGFLFSGSISFFCAMAARNRIGTVGLSLVVTQSMGILVASGAYMDDSVIRMILMFHPFYQLGQLGDAFPSVHIPFAFTVVTSLVWTGLIMLASESLFIKRDLK